MIIKNVANNKRNSASLYNTLCENIADKVMPEVNRMLREEYAIEEGWFSTSPKKPSQNLTDDFIRTANSDEIAKVMAEHLNYWAASASDSIDKALSNSVKGLLDICKSGTDKAEETSKKVLKGIVDAVRLVIKGGANLAIDSVKGIGRVIMLGAAMCLKLGANGVKAGEAAVRAIYRSIAEFLTSSYEALKDKVEKGIDAVKDGLSIFLKVSLAVILLCANKVQGAAEAFGAWIKGVAKNIADKTVLAVITVRTWFAVTSKEVAEWVKTTVGNVRSACVDAWNALEKKITKVWKEISNKIIEWANEFRMTIAEIGKKIADTMTAAGEHIIAGKDKAVVYGIGKAVKALSKNYTEDDVVAIVRAAYNEDLHFDENDNTILNEAYYTKTNLRPIHI